MLTEDLLGFLPLFLIVLVIGAIVYSITKAKNRPAKSVAIAFEKKTNCPHCNQQYIVTDENLGMTVCCSKCNNNFVVETLTRDCPVCANFHPRPVEYD